MVRIVTIIYFLREEMLKLLGDLILLRLDQRKPLDIRCLSFSKIYE